MTHKQQIVMNLALSAAAGAAIWALSPVWTGQREPWDAGGLYYPATLFLAGIVLGAIGPLLLLGVVFLSAYSLLTFGGAALGVALRKA